MNHVNVFARRFAAFGLVACLQTTSACSSRATAVRTPTPPEQGGSERPVSSPPTAPLPRGETDQCGLIAAGGEPIETVALTDRIDPANAPRPSNESERLLFRQLYETLVRIDCEGRVTPALAASWRLSVDGRTWVVTLRPDAHFSDGVQVTSSNVLA